MNVLDPRRDPADQCAVAKGNHYRVECLAIHEFHGDRTGALRDGNIPTVFDGDRNSGPDYSITGVRGDASLATSEKGRKVLDAMAKELIDGIQAIFPEAFAPRAAKLKAAPRRNRGAGAKRRR
mgnify:CR=1 FL=1